jgi:hypothetical protein
VPDLTRDDILTALMALGSRLAAAGMHAEIFIVGGAAMALAYSDRRLTRDIDAAFEPKSVVYDAAALVAADLGLPADWLNDAAKGFMPGADPQARVLPDMPGIGISVASPQYLLAMKLMALRIPEDEDDIAVLLSACGITTAQQAIDLVTRMYPHQVPLPKTRFYLEQVFGA